MKRNPTAFVARRPSSFFRHRPFSRSQRFSLRRRPVPRGSPSRHLGLPGHRPDPTAKRRNTRPRIRGTLTLGQITAGHDPDRVPPDPRRWALRPDPVAVTASMAPESPERTGTGRSSAQPLVKVRRKPRGTDDGDRQMVDILGSVLTEGRPAVDAACAEAIVQGVHSVDVVLNIRARRRDPAPPNLLLTSKALRLPDETVADCARNDRLRSAG